MSFPSLDEVNSLVDEHEMLKLRELSDEYNKTGEYLIPNYQTKTEYIFSLWMRNVDIPNCLTYGEPYDSKIKAHAHSNALFTKNMNVNENTTYLAFIHDKYYLPFLLSYIHREYFNHKNNGYDHESIHSIFGSSDITRKIFTKELIEEGKMY